MDLKKESQESRHQFSTIVQMRRLKKKEVFMTILPREHWNACVILEPEILRHWNMTGMLCQKH